MKKIKAVSLLLSLLFVAFSFSACITDKEKEEAKSNANTAKPIIQQYVDAHYNGGKISEVKCALYDTSDAIFGVTSSYASNFVRATVKYNNKSFYVMTNIKTNAVYDDYNKDKIIESICSSLYSNVKIDNAKEIDVRYYCNSINKLSPAKTEYFAEYGIESIDELKQKDDYQIYVACKYADSKMDFSKIDAKNFVHKYKNSLYGITFVNYRDNDSFSYGNINLRDNGFSFSQKDDYHNIDCFKSCVCDKEYIDSEDDYYEEYNHYSLKKYSSMEFAWNDLEYDLTFSTENAESPLTLERYDGTFYSVDGKLTKIDYKLTSNNESNDGCRVYMYFDKSSLDKYLITNLDSNDGIQNAETITTYNNTSETFYEKSGWLKVGIYSLVNNNEQK